MMDYVDGGSSPETGVICDGAGKSRHQARLSDTIFQSILYQNDDSHDGQTSTGVPAYFRDLNLDQIVTAITNGKDEYDLKPYFYQSLKTPDEIAYRHEIMRDMETERVHGSIRSFADSMHLMREHLTTAGKLYHKYQKERWFLHAAETYCTAVLQLQRDLIQLNLSSHGLLSFRDYVVRYTNSNSFVHLLEAVNILTRDLGKIQFSLLIKDDGLKVQSYAQEIDYSSEISDVFAKFRQGVPNNYLVKFHDYREANSIEEIVLDFVALLNPEIFSGLDAFCKAHRDYVDPALTRFDREIQFYVSYIEYISPLKWTGLRFCYPQILTDEKNVSDEGGFDLALASKLVNQKEHIVCNDFYLSGDERIFVISGPNQGGKTTFARTFGQLHHLASIGCPIPGKVARMFLFDALFTHFEREEEINSVDGKLQDDLLRFHEILSSATPRSIVIINEIFGATTLQDAIYLAGKVIGQIIELDALCVCVTFLDELATLSRKTISMVTTVMPENTEIRTFKVIRRPADGRTYAISLAERYRLTYDHLTSRLRF